MMTQNDDAYVLEWLEQAHSDAQSAISLAKSGQRPQALVHVQQSIEKAVKGILLSSGVPYAEVKKLGHDNVDSFFELSKRISKRDLVANLLQKLVDQTALQELEYVQALARGKKRRNNRKRSEEETKFAGKVPPSLDFAAITDEDSARLRAEIATLPPKIVEGLVGMLQKTSDAMHSATTIPFKLPSPPPDGDLLRWLYNQIRQQIFIRLPKHSIRALSPEEIEVVKGCISLIGESRLREALAQPSEWRIGLHFEWVMAYLTLYVVGFIAWPHAVSARYPAPPESRTDAMQAAVEDQLGTQHYTDEIGALKHVGMLARQAEVATNALIKCHSKGIRLYPDADPAEKPE